jgi:hypothetical protein
MFEELVSEIRRFVMREVEEGLIDVRDYQEFPRWERRKDVILRGELAYEFGKQNSILLLTWGKAENRIYLPTNNGKDRLAVIVISDAEIEDVYECFRAMRDTFYSLNLRGVTIRSLPSQMRVWLRVGRGADREGFNLGVFGRAIIESMNSLDFVRATDVVFFTSREEIEKLKEQFSKGKKIVEALIKMHEEKLLNCEECDYSDVCSEIPELRRIRERMRLKERDKR